MLPMDEPYSGSEYPDTADASLLRRALLASQRLARENQAKVDTLAKINHCLCEELSEQERKLAEVQQLAHYDLLTGLPTRALLQDRFQLAIANAVRHRQQLAVLFLDLNDFKKVNDQHGHVIGDKLLKRVAKRLTGSLRAIDTACRYGGDEFVVLLPDIGTTTSATGVRRKINQTLALPYHIEQVQLHLNVSIGIALYPLDGESFDELLHKADQDMYLDKAGGLPIVIEVVALDPESGLAKPKKKRGKHQELDIGNSPHPR